MPRHQTLPPAQTSSAREALQSFYCQLCQKGYSRMNDYEAHLGSYDHSHKQRMKDMKVMVRDPNAAARARRQEQKAEGLVSIKLGDAAGSAPGAGFKKGGFKKTGFKPAFAPTGDTTDANTQAGGADKDEAAPSNGFKKAAFRPTAETTDTGISAMPAGGLDSLAESDTDDEGYEVYDPAKPTD